MSMIAAVALAGLLAASASPGDGFPERRVGVLVLGPDDAGPGDLQRVLELRLNALPDVAAIGATEVAAKASRAVEPPDPVAAIAKEAEAILAEVQEAYYTNQSVKALDRLAALKSLYDRAGTLEARRRAEFLLWRTAVLLLLGDDANAEIEATEALTLKPDLEVDLTVFKPSVAKEVKRIRARLGKAVKVSFLDAPAGARVRLDETRLETLPAGAAPALFVFPGKHTVEVSAPGRRTWRRDVNVKGDVALRPSLAVALDATLADSLSATIWSGSMEGSAGRELTRLVPELGLDWLLAVATRTEPNAEVRGMLVSLSPRADLYSKVFSLSVAPAAIADWAESTMRAPREGSSEGGSTQQPGVTPPPPGATPAPSPVPAPRKGSGRTRSRLFAPADEPGPYVVLSGGVQLPQESNYSEERALPGAAGMVVAGYRAPLGLCIEGGVQVGSIRVGDGGAVVTDPFVGFRIMPMRIGKTVPSLTVAFSPWSVLTFQRPIDIREGRTDMLRGNSITLGLGARRPIGRRRFFVVGDARYTLARYHSANADGSVSTGRLLNGDSLSMLLGAGLRF